MRVVACGADEFGMHLDAGNSKSGHSRLPGPKHVSLSTQFEILFGNAEAIFGVAHDRKASLGGLAQRSSIKQKASRPLCAPPDAPAQLMQLRKAEALGVLDHHDGRLGHV